MTFRIQHRNTIRNVRIMIRTLRMIGIGAMPSLRGARGRGLGGGGLGHPGLLEGRDGAGGIHVPRFGAGSWGSDRYRDGVEAGAGVPGIGGSSALDVWFPAETMRQADASRSSLSRPSIDLPPIDYTLGSNTCAKIGRVASYGRAPKRCPNGHRLGPHRVVVGWTPCTCATALRPSGASGHRTYLCIVCDAEILIPPHTGPPFSGVQWAAEADAGAAAARLVR